MSINIILCGVGTLRTGICKGEQKCESFPTQVWQPCHTETVPVGIYLLLLHLLSPVTSVESRSNCSLLLGPLGKCITMCCTSFIPAYNSAEGPREEDGGVTVEEEDWSSGALSSVIQFSCWEWNLFHWCFSLQNSDCTTTQLSGAMLRRQPVFLKGILKAEMLVSLVCLH